MPSSEVMHKWKRGQLHSGSKTGPLVKGQKQAVAIMLSEKRNEAEHGGEYVHKHERGGAVDSKLMKKGGEIGPHHGNAKLPERTREMSKKLHEGLHPQGKPDVNRGPKPSGTSGPGPTPPLRPKMSKGGSVNKR